MGLLRSRWVWVATVLVAGVTGCRTECEDLADVCAKCPEAAQKSACEFVVDTDDADFCDRELEAYPDAGCE